MTESRERYRVEWKSELNCYLIYWIGDVMKFLVAASINENTNVDYLKMRLGFKQQGQVPILQDGKYINP